MFVVRRLSFIWFSKASLLNILQFPAILSINALFIKWVCLSTVTRGASVDLMFESMWNETAKVALVKPV